MGGWVVLVVGGWLGEVVASWCLLLRMHPHRFSVVFLAPSDGTLYPDAHCGGTKVSRIQLRSVDHVPMAVCVCGVVVLVLPWDPAPRCTLRWDES